VWANDKTATDTLTIRKRIFMFGRTPVQTTHQKCRQYSIQTARLANSLIAKSGTGSKRNEESDGCSFRFTSTGRLEKRTGYARKNVFVPAQKSIIDHIFRVGSNYRFGW